jgi:hypothetical protein
LEEVSKLDTAKEKDWKNSKPSQLNKIENTGIQEDQGK